MRTKTGFLFFMALLLGLGGCTPTKKQEGETVSAEAGEKTGEDAGEKERKAEKEKEGTERKLLFYVDDGQLYCYDIAKNKSEKISAHKGNFGQDSFWGCREDVVSGGGDIYYMEYEDSSAYEEEEYHRSYGTLYRRLKGTGETERIRSDVREFELLPNDVLLFYQGDRDRLYLWKDGIRNMLSDNVLWYQKSADGRKLIFEVEDEWTELKEYGTGTLYFVSLDSEDISGVEKEKLAEDVYTFRGASDNFDRLYLTRQKNDTESLYCIRDYGEERLIDQAAAFMWTSVASDTRKLCYVKEREDANLNHGWVLAEPDMTPAELPEVPELSEKMKQGMAESGRIPQNSELFAYAQTLFQNEYIDNISTTMFEDGSGYGIVCSYDGKEKEELYPFARSIEGKESEQSSGRNFLFHVLPDTLPEKTSYSALYSEYLRKMWDAVMEEDGEPDLERLYYRYFTNAPAEQIGELLMSEEEHRAQQEEDIWYDWQYYNASLLAAEELAAQQMENLVKNASYRCLRKGKETVLPTEGKIREWMEDKGSGDLYYLAGSSFRQDDLSEKQYYLEGTWSAMTLYRLDAASGRSEQSDENVDTISAAFDGKVYYRKDTGSYGNGGTLFVSGKRLLSDVSVVYPAEDAVYLIGEADTGGEIELYRLEDGKTIKLIGSVREFLPLSGKRIVCLYNYDAQYGEGTLAILDKTKTETVIGEEVSRLVGALGNDSIFGSG